jgi:adenylate kinase
MLREAVKAGSPVGREARGYMEKGELVPDAVILRIVRERIAAGPATARYLFDGFPRTIAQADGLEALLAEFGAQVRAVFRLDVPREVLIDRLAGRRICTACGAVYHVRNIPTRVEGVCDRCGGPTVQRPDDREATVANRLDVYRKQTESLIAYYRERGVLFDIAAAGAKDETTRRIVERLPAA